MSEQQTHQGPTLVLTFPDGSIAVVPVHATEPGHFALSVRPPETGYAEAGQSDAGRWSRDMLTPAQGVSVRLDF